MDNGLTNEEVIKSRIEYGGNSFSKKKKDSYFKLLLETFSDPIIKILLIALGIKVIFLIRDFNWYETIGIVLAILVASLISSISEYGSIKAFDKLTEESSQIMTKVIREGKVLEIKVSEVVVGDLVKLVSGDKIPADGRVIRGNLLVDESIISGESKEVEKNSGDYVYMNTVIYSGEAIIKIEKVGDSTFYGHMMGQMQDNDVSTPLKIRLTKLANGISKIGYICSFLVGLSYLFYMVVICNNFDIEQIIGVICDGRVILGYILEALTLCVSIIVVAVPEGLPMMITLVLSSNMRRMVKDKVLVRKLIGIETAGNINILFTDKTGTLTNGELEVIGFLDGNGEEIDYVGMNKELKEMFNNSMYINNEGVYDKSNNKIIGGNVTDKAILNYVKEYQVNYELIEKDGFDSKKKYMHTKIKYKGHIVNLVKGATEYVIPNCNLGYLGNGKKVSINKEVVNRNIDKIAINKIRVLALAINQDRETINNMTLLGFVLLKDTVRENVVTGVSLVKEAGIQTVMITGDNVETALGIAREVGIIDSPEQMVITHDKLALLSDDEIKRLLPKIRVVARAMPDDKSRLVRIANEMDLVTGMTGDGVNDALALKKASVGFAMGSGTEVSKEASDIVILDDNFYAIAKAILYGRTIFKSIRKFIICQLTINFCSLCVSMIGPFMGIPVPITVVQMLWINMIMDTLSGFAFSYEPALREYMKEPPKLMSEGIINRYMFNQIMVTGVYSAILCIFFLKSRVIKGIYGTHLLTAFFGLIIFISIFNSFAARTDRLNIFGNILKNKVFIGVMIFVILMQIYLIYYGGEVFRTGGLTGYEFMIMLGLSMTVIPVEIIRKMILKRKGIRLGV